jgi:RimJ/RimL family protein N-acetyltransferase
LSTGRLVLRAWPAGDVAAVLGGTRPPHWAADFPADGDRVIAGVVAEHPEGQFQIVERGTGLVVGSIGLFWPPRDGTVEIGYGVVPSRRGLGYAAEAARALAGHALTVPGVHTVYAEVEFANPPSVRVLEKAGFRRFSAGEETARYRFG